MKQGFTEAKNNLGRLEIQDGNYEAAVYWLNQGIKQAKDNTVKYSLYKNLGWARLKQKRYAQAEAQLQLAIALDGRKAAAYCLLAETLEAQKKLKEAHEAWENCLRYASIYYPDEDTWTGLTQLSHAIAPTTQRVGGSFHQDW